MNFSEDLKVIPVFKVVCTVADRLGLETYAVGGYVRDLLLKRPCKDIDFVCVGSGIALAEAVAKELGHVQVNAFKNFGTAMIKFEIKIFELDHRV